MLLRKKKRSVEHIHDALQQSFGKLGIAMCGTDPRCAICKSYSLLSYHIVNTINTAYSTCRRCPACVRDFSTCDSSVKFYSKEKTRKKVLILFQVTNANLDVRPR